MLKIVVGLVAMLAASFFVYSINICPRIKKDLKKVVEKIELRIRCDKYKDVEINNRFYIKEIIRIYKSNFKEVRTLIDLVALLYLFLIANVFILTMAYGIGNALL